MSQFPCCEPVGTGGGENTPVSMINIGGFAEWYVNATGPNPFEIRTAQSSDGSVGIVQNADNNDFTVDFGANVSLQNIGGFAELYVNATGPNPFDLRTFQSSDGSVGIVQNADNLDFTVGAPAVSMQNVGTGLDVYVAASGPNPFDIRRLAVIDDGSDIHGDGNLAFWTDGNTNKIDLPRGSVQNNTSISVNNVLTVLIDHTFGDDSAGANVAGKDGEDWLVWWSLKICGDPGQPLTDQVYRLRSHNGAWVVEDDCHSRTTVGVTPSDPETRPYRLDNTDWSTNGGLRLSIQVATNSVFVFNEFEHPSIIIQRFNQVPP